MLAEAVHGFTGVGRAVGAVGAGLGAVFGRQDDAGLGPGGDGLQGGRCGELAQHTGHQGVGVEQGGGWVACTHSSGLHQLRHDGAQLVVEHGVHFGLISLGGQLG